MRGRSGRALSRAERESLGRPKRAARAAFLASSDICCCCCCWPSPVVVAAETVPKRAARAARFSASVLASVGGRFCEKTGLLVALVEVLSFLPALSP